MKNNNIPDEEGLSLMASACAQIEDLIVAILPALKDLNKCVEADDSASIKKYNEVAEAAGGSPYDSMTKRLNLFIKFGEELTAELKAVDHPILKEQKRVTFEKEPQIHAAVTMAVIETPSEMKRLDTKKPFIQIANPDGKMYITFNQFGMLYGAVKGTAKRLVDEGKLPKDNVPEDWL